MLPIIEQATNAVNNGARFKVDFEKRELRIGKTFLVKDGEYEGNSGVSVKDNEDFIRQLEQIYSTYKHSIPSERSEGKAKRYFKALEEHELSDEDMMYGLSREVAQCRLETFFLLCSIQGLVDWNKEPFNNRHWFWKSTTDPDLIILKKWVKY